MEQTFHSATALSGKSLNFYKQLNEQLLTFSLIV